MENLMSGVLMVVSCACGLHFFDVRLDPDPEKNTFLYAVMLGVAYGLAVSIGLVRLWS